MKFARLVWANLMRARRRTILTTLSVAAALFLFVTLRSVITALEDVKEVGAESRMVTRNAISIVFLLPRSYQQWLENVDGVERVTWAVWFGGIYRDPRDFFAQFAIDADTYLDVYPEMEIPEDQEEAFLRERTAALVGEGLMERFGWELGQTVSLRSTIWNPDGEWPFTIRAVYTPTNPSYGDQMMFFHYEYLYENSGQIASPGWYVLELEDPSMAATVAETIDDHYRNSAAATRTETERAFQTSFVTMWGNVGFMINAVGMAVFFAILLVAVNTMLMAARERTGEVAVLKTLGFTERLVFVLILVEALVITVTGGVLGVGAAELAVGGADLQNSAFLPGFEIKTGTALLGIAIAVALGGVAGIIPAWQSARLSVVETLRRVA